MVELETNVTPPTAETVIVLERVPLARFDTADELMSKTKTNVPQTVIWHSPDGFEWGYGGSGPADLALNILNWFVPPNSDGLHRRPCWKGFCSQTAARLHQEFKAKFIATLPKEGGAIEGADVIAFLDKARPAILEEYSWQLTEPDPEDEDTDDQ